MLPARQLFHKLMTDLGCALSVAVASDSGGFLRSHGLENIHLFFFDFAT